MAIPKKKKEKKKDPFLDLMERVLTNWLILAASYSYHGRRCIRKWAGTILTPAGQTTYMYMYASL